MANVYRGDIFYVENRVNLNPVGSEMWSGRPAVIVSDDAHNLASDTVTVVYLTTKEKQQSPVHVPVHTTCPAVAMCEQITCVDASRLGKYICHATDDEMAAIDRALADLLGLPTVPAAKNEPTEEKSKESKVTPELAAAAGKINDLWAVDLERDLYKRLYEQLLERMFGK